MAVALSIRATHLRSLSAPVDAPLHVSFAPDRPTTAKGVHLLVYGFWWYRKRFDKQTRIHWITFAVSGRHAAMHTWPGKEPPPSPPVRNKNKCRRGRTANLVHFTACGELSPADWLVYVFSSTEKSEPLTRPTQTQRHGVPRNAARNYNEKPSEQTTGRRTINQLTAYVLGQRPASIPRQTRSTATFKAFYHRRVPQINGWLSAPVVALAEHQATALIVSSPTSTRAGFF